MDRLKANEHRERTLERYRPNGRIFWQKDANREWISYTKTQLNAHFANNYPDEPWDKDKVYSPETGWGIHPVKEMWNSNQEANSIMIRKLDERYSYAKAIIFILLLVIANAYGW